MYKCILDGIEVKRYVINVIPNKRRDGKWSEWNSWSSCSATCGFGSQTRTRYCLTRNCQGPNFEANTCQVHDCIQKDAPQQLYLIRPDSDLTEWMGYSFKPYHAKDYSNDRQTYCRKGYSWDILYSKCIDINECKMKSSCSRGLRCINTKGSYRCLACPKGFMGIRSRCLGSSDTLTNLKSSY